MSNFHLYSIRRFIHLLIIICFIFGYSKISNAAWYYVPDIYTTNVNSKIVLFDAAGIRLAKRLNTFTQAGGFVMSTLTPSTPSPLNQVGLIIPPLSSSMLISTTGSNVLPKNWYLNFNGVVAAGMFSAAFFIVAVSNIAGYYVGILISMVGFRRF